MDFRQHTLDADPNNFLIRAYDSLLILVIAVGGLAFVAGAVLIANPSGWRWWNGSVSRAC